MPALNCHFVSRFLTRPWEQGQRHLWYFDFERNQVLSRSSDSLFASRGTNSLEVEQRLDSIVETPLAQARQQLAAATSDQQDWQLEWPLFRALALLMMLQPLRAPGHSQRAEKLEQTILRPDQELNEIARGVAERYRLGRISVRPDAPLLYASTGFFPLYAAGLDDCYVAAIAIPISLQHVFVAVPVSIDWHSAAQLWAQNGAGMVANASVGLSGSVVLPPAFKALRRDDEIASMLNEMRTSLKELAALCRQANDVLTRLNEDPLP